MFIWLISKINKIFPIFEDDYENTDELVVKPIKNILRIYFFQTIHSNYSMYSYSITKNDFTIRTGVKSLQPTEQNDIFIVGLTDGLNEVSKCKLDQIIVECDNHEFINKFNSNVKNKKIKLLEKNFNSITYNLISPLENNKNYLLCENAIKNNI